MNAIKNIILRTLALVAFVSTQSAMAASWYVDNAVVSSGAGQSWTTAFKSMSAVTWASVRPGDRVLISGGPLGSSKTYTDSWSVGASGTVASPIVITVDASNASHNGVATFDFEARGDRATADGITVANRAYVTFNGNVNGANHLVIKNLRNVVDRTTATCLTGYGDTSIIVDHVDFINCNNGIRLSGSSVGTGSRIQNSNFRQIRGDVAIMLNMGGSSFDVHTINNNNIELLTNTAVPPGGSNAYVGPDGIQPGDGVSIHDNVIRVTATTLYTSNQHTDDIQFGMARYLKIYNNEFVNVGDSVIDLGTWGSNTAVRDIFIYNNIFRIETKNDPYPQYIRLYANPGNISSITNVKILNNLFLDGEPAWPVIDFQGYGGNPTASGIEVRNNIFYSTAGIMIKPSPAFTSSSFAFSNNVYYPGAGTAINFNGQLYTASSWVAAREISGKLTAPLFVAYKPKGSSNDLHLTANDSTARNNGISLSSYFATDKSGVSRPQDSLWDIGPFEFRTVAPLVLPPINLQVN